jgi:RNA polymerase sigma factor (sigma-70 family)
MSDHERGSVVTRESMLRQLKAGEAEGWNRFYAVYGRLVRDFSVHAGLSESDADDVVQETAIAVSRHIAEFKYERDVCRFKTWLLNQATWRIKDHWKKRARAQQLYHQTRRDPATHEQTSTAERVPAEAVDYTALFEIEWQKNLLALALEAIRTRFDLRQIQIYDLHAIQGWRASEVAKALSVSVASVYVTKHRIATALKKEVRRLSKAG